MKFASVWSFFSLIKQTISEKKDRPFFKGGLGSLVIKFGNLLLQFGLGIVLARTLGVEAFGVYTFIYAIIKIIAIPTELGLPNLLIRFIPKYHTEKKWSKINALLKFTNGTIVFVSFFIISISMLFIHYDIVGFTENKLDTFYWGLALLPVLALGNLRGAALRGFRHFLLGLIPESIFRHIFFMGIVIILYFLKGENLSSQEGMAYQFIAFFLAYLIGAYWLFRYMPQEVKKAKPSFEIKKWLTVAMPFLLAGGMQIIMGKIDKVLLGILGSTVNVGIYEIAVKGATLVSFSLGAINFVLGPYFSKYFSNNQMVELQKIATYSVIANSVLAFGIAGGLILFGDVLLGFMFGREFIDGYSVLIILSVAQFLSVLSGSVALLLNMTGYEKDVLNGMLIGVLLNVTLNIIFIPRYGINGAAVTSLITIILWNFYMAYISIKKLKIDPTIISTYKLFKNAE